MSTVDILYSYYINSNGVGMKIGGVQTYISNLCRVVESLGYRTRIFQFAEKEFENTLSPLTKVIGVPVEGNTFQKNDALYKAALSGRTDDKYLTIFASDLQTPKYYVPDSISIQHGIFWDIPTKRNRSLLKDFISKAINAYNTVQRVSRTDEVVCVDNNFICWYRTQVGASKIKLIPIMNFTEVLPLKERAENDSVKIVFARRFEEYRGTKLFAKIVKRLLQDYPSLCVTFAGEGSDEKYLKDELSAEPRVVFTKYASQDSVAFHRDYDIAVVPTIGSEGTSLSVLEAMAAGCAVVCTNVGGMTNIVIDKYNGLMVSPDEDALYEAIKQLVDDRALRLRIAKNGYDVVKEGFSAEIWDNSWAKVIKNKMESIE